MTFLLDFFSFFSTDETEEESDESQDTTEDELDTTESITVESTPDEDSEDTVDTADDLFTADDNSSTEYEEFHDELKQAVESVSEGDLSTQVDVTNAPDDARDIAEEFNEMVEEMRTTIQKVDDYSDQIEGATERVTSRITDVKSASKEMSEEVNQIADGSEDQNEQLQGLSDEIRNLSATTEEVASSANEVAQQSENAADKGEEGRDLAAEALAELDDIDTRTSKTVETTRELNSQIDEIKEIVEFIRSVAEQTNILALNASIEAARSGEAGDGFAGVAEEVKSLAEDTEEAAGDIEESIDAIKGQANQTVDQIEETNSSVESGIETVEDAIEALQEIADSVEETNIGIQEISEATDQQAESLQEAASVIDEVSEIADDTESRTRKSADAAEQQTTALSEVSTGATTLEERSSSLDELTESFNTTQTTTNQEDVVSFDFWHAMGGDKGLLLENLIREFENQTEGIQINATSKGSYRGTLESTLNSSNPPELSQIYEVGTAKAIDSNMFTPVQNILPNSVDLNTYLDPILSYYQSNNTLHSMPFNSSVPILAINKDAFTQAGLDTENPPQKFTEVREAAEKIVKSGACKYGITFANYGWFVEQWFASDGQQIVNKNNGRAGTPDKALFNSETGVDLYNWWTELEKDDLYKNPGVEARGKAKQVFHNENAAMLIGSSSSIGSITSGSEFEINISGMPVDTTRDGLIVGGASLWVSDSATTQQQEAVGEFLEWMTQPEQQAKWHKETGYLPITQKSIQKLESEGWFKQNPGHKIAIKQLLNSPNTPATNGARIGPFDTIRTLVAESYEDIKSGNTKDELDQLNTKIERKLKNY